MTLPKRNFCVIAFPNVFGKKLGPVFSLSYVAGMRSRKSYVLEESCIIIHKICVLVVNNMGFNKKFLKGFINTLPETAFFAVN